MNGPMYSVLFTFSLSSCYRKKSVDMHNSFTELMPVAKLCSLQLFLKESEDGFLPCNHSFEGLFYIFVKKLNGGKVYQMVIILACQGCAIDLCVGVQPSILPV